LFNDFKIGLTRLIESIVSTTEETDPEAENKEKKKGLIKS